MPVVEQFFLRLTADSNRTSANRYLDGKCAVYQLNIEGIDDQKFEEHEETFVALGDGRACLCIFCGL
jgi:hypothetical protein